MRRDRWNYRAASWLVDHIGPIPALLVTIAVMWVCVYTLWYLLTHVN